MPTDNVFLEVRARASEALAAGTGTTLEIDKFAQAIRCRRVPRALVPSAPDNLGMYHVTAGARIRPWRDSQVLLTTEDFVYVLPNAMTAGNPLDLLTAARTTRAFALLPLFEKDLGKGGKVGRVQIEAWAEPLSSLDLDRAVNVCQDLGRWDMAVLLILSLFGSPPFDPESIQWAGFPHTSRMAFVFEDSTHGARGFIPSGATKQVLEAWWAVNGGYHAASIWLPAADEFRAFMEGAQNPWAAVGVDPGVVGRQLRADLLPVLHPRPSGRWDSRYASSSGGVGYRGDENGVVRPFYFVTGTPPATPVPEKVAWGKEFRDELVRHMGLPIFVVREMGL